MLGLGLSVLNDETPVNAGAGHPKGYYADPSGDFYFVSPDGTEYYRQPEV